MNFRCGTYFTGTYNFFSDTELDSVLSSVVSGMKLAFKRKFPDTKNIRVDTVSMIYTYNREKDRHEFEFSIPVEEVSDEYSASQIEG